MGFFGSLIGWDQSMGAVNAVMANFLIKRLVDPPDRIKIAKEVVKIISSVYPRQTIDDILQDLSNQTRVVQMNFIALACDNLQIPPLRNNVWTRIKNPYQLKDQLTDEHISTAIRALEKQDGIYTDWPGDTVKIDFKKMYEDGMCNDSLSTHHDV